jgi:hypothetical protein
MGKYSCCVNLGQVTFPKDMLGMKVRFKLEIINEDEQTPTQQVTSSPSLKEGLPTDNQMQLRKFSV